jgi:hypothetical protein
MTVSTLAYWFFWAALAWMLGAMIVYGLHGIGLTRRNPVVRGPSGEPTGEVKADHFTEIYSWLRQVLHHGRDGAFVALRHPETGHAIRFQKSVSGDADRGISLTIPEGATDPNDIARVKARCAAHGLTCDEQGPAGPLSVDCGMDAVRAYALAWDIWTADFGLAAKTTCALSIDGIDLGWSFPARLVDTTFMVSSIGLPAATLLSAGEPPDWSIPLGNGATASGSIASLTFLLAYSISFVCKAFGKRPAEPARTVGRMVYVAGMRLIIIALPAAVLLVWASV